MTAAVKNEEAENWILDYLARKPERNKLCYPFDPLEITPVDLNGKPWLIKGIIARRETSAWIAPPGAMKSALMAQLSMCVGNGADWNGHQHKGCHSVLYFALERHDLVRRRLWAQRTRMGVDDSSVAVATGMVDLATAEGVNRLTATIEEAGREFGNPVGLVIFDTFAKLVAASGLDENKASDQGRIFANLQRVKDRIDAKWKIGAPHFAIVGHTGKDVERGARGSNAFYGDVDIMVEISTSGEIRTASITKANDLPEGPLFSFGSEIHEFGKDEDGDPITVNIVSDVPVATQSPKATNKKLNQKQSVFYRLLYDAGNQGLTLADWNAQGKDLGFSKSTMFGIRKTLEDSGMVREYGGIWKVNHD